MQWTGFVRKKGIHNEEVDFYSPYNITGIIMSRKKNGHIMYGETKKLQSLDREVQW
jgi:hypothetical protein